MGLYAPNVVEPSDPSNWPPAERQLTITLDDVLIEDGKMAPFKRSGSTFTAMGCFGNVMLMNGETHFSGEVAVGEVVRLYLVNTANTRIFDFALRGARMKLVGDESGRHEREAIVEEVLLSPSERAVVDVLLYITNPGLWMAHCHIAEHTEGGMMFSFEVAPSSEGEGSGERR